MPNGDTLIAESFLKSASRESTVCPPPFKELSTPKMTTATIKRAELNSISLSKLLEGNVDAADELVSACKINGFFYLDFRGVATSETLKQVDELVDVGNSIFKLPLEEKERYSTEKYLPSRLQGHVGFF